MKVLYDDGGRREAGYRGEAGDCAVRAIAIATQLDYKQVYDDLNLLCKEEKITKRRKSKSHSGSGVWRITYEKYLKDLGWKWVPTMFIGSGCKVHLSASELPKGRLVTRLSKHLAAVVDGVLHDTHDCSRLGTRCVYGYFIKDV